MDNDSLHSETLDILNHRVSVRDYDDRPVDDAIVGNLLRTAFRAPTSSNIQAYSVIIVKDPKIRQQLAEITGGQRHVIAAPVFLAFCADLTRLEQAMAVHGHDMGTTNLEMGLVSSIDAALIGMSTYLAAESVGLKGVMIGAVRNNAAATAEALGLPNRVYCVFGMCLGWPATVPRQKPRMASTAMIHHDRYGQLDDALTDDERLAQYDHALADHYQSIGKSTHERSWTHEIDAKFNTQPRASLREQLSALGFDFA